MPESRMYVICPTGQAMYLRAWGRYAVRSLLPIPWHSWFGAGARPAFLGQVTGTGRLRPFPTVIEPKRYKYRARTPLTFAPFFLHHKVESQSNESQVQVRNTTMNHYSMIRGPNDAKIALPTTPFPRFPKQLGEILTLISRAQGYCALLYLILGGREPLGPTITSTKFKKFTFKGIGASAIKAFEVVHTFRKVWVCHLFGVLLFFLVIILLILFHQACRGVLDFTSH